MTHFEPDYPDRNTRIAQIKARKLRSDLTREELERLEKYGSLEFKSAGAVRGWMVAPEVLKAEAERIQGLINR